MNFSKIRRYWTDTVRLMVGLPSYDVYVEHMRRHHPDQHCMTYEEFFKNRQEARYNGKDTNRCC